jgi:hypothetical protein
MIESREISQNPENIRPDVSNYWAAHLRAQADSDDLRIQKDIMARSLTEIGINAPGIVSRMMDFATANLLYQDNDYTHPTSSTTVKRKQKSSRDSLAKSYRMPEEHGGDAEFVLSGKITTIGSKEIQIVIVKKPTDTAFLLTVVREVLKSSKEGVDDKIVKQKLQKVDGTGAWDLETHGKSKHWHVQGRGYQQKDVYPSDPLITFNWFLDAATEIEAKEKAEKEAAINLNEDLQSSGLIL